LDKITIGLIFLLVVLCSFINPFVFAVFFLVCVAVALSDRARDFVSSPFGKQPPEDDKS